MTKTKHSWLSNDIPLSGHHQQSEQLRKVGTKQGVFLLYLQYQADRSFLSTTLVKFCFRSNVVPQNIQIHLTDLCRQSCYRYHFGSQTDTFSKSHSSCENYNLGLNCSKAISTVSILQILQIPHTAVRDLESTLPINDYAQDRRRGPVAPCLSPSDRIGPLESLPDICEAR